MTVIQQKCLVCGAVRGECGTGHMAAGFTPGRVFTGRWINPGYDMTGARS